MWLLMIRKGWTQRDVKEALGVVEGVVPRLLFGDRRPDLKLATKVESLLKIRSSAWHEAPTKLFDVPEVLPVPTAERKRWAA